MPIATFALTSGTKMTVRPSLRPRATSSSLRGDGALGAREDRSPLDALASPIDNPPSTTVIVPPSMP